MRPESALSFNGEKTDCGILALINAALAAKRIKIIDGGICGHSLSGHVGYRIIAANIRELTEPAALLQAWC